MSVNFIQKHPSLPPFRWEISTAQVVHNSNVERKGSFDKLYISVMVPYFSLLITVCVRMQPSWGMFSHGRFMFSLSGFGRRPEFAPALAQFLRKAGCAA